MIDSLKMREPPTHIFQSKNNDPYILEICKGRLQLKKHDKPRLGAIYVDFVTGTNQYRRKFGGGRGQAIARAVGLKKGATPLIIDATAGLGRDAFVLASLGCRVYMIERSPVIAKLLEDGLNRAKCDTQIGHWVSKLMSLVIDDSQSVLSALLFKPDVVYLDPMYPEKRKSALVRKEMRALKELVGGDPDSDHLFEKAFKVAHKRVVVKRPAHAGWLANRAPTTSIKTKKNRFDIYLTSST